MCEYFASVGGVGGGLLGVNGVCIVKLGCQQQLYFFCLLHNLINQNMLLAHFKRWE